MGSIVNYKCPNCAAPLSFGIESQQWECHFCNSTFTAAQMDEFEALAGSAETEAAWEAGAFAQQDTVVYSCPNCGGRVLTEPNTAATFCVYCHSPTVIAAQLSGEYRPAKLIPFQLTKDDALAELKRMCRKKPFLSKEFRQCVNKGEVTGLYVPYWLFGADYDATLSGTARKIRTWRDSNYIYTQTDTYRLHRRANIPLKLVPVDASSRMDDRMMEGIEPFEYASLVEFSMQYLSGHLAESYDVDAAVCRKQFDSRAGDAVNTAMRNLVLGYNSTHGVSIHAEAHNASTLYVMLPAWVVMAEHKGKKHAFIMNGQTGKMVGSLPVSPPRVGAWFGGLSAACTLLFTLLFMMGGLL